MKQQAIIRLAFFTTGLAVIISGYGQCVRYEGLYVADSPDNSEYKTYLRFFTDGTVLLADSKSPQEEVEQWMEKGRETITETTFESAKDCKVEYEIELNDTKISYEGKLSTSGETMEITRSVKKSQDVIISYSFVEVAFDE